MRENCPCGLVAGVSLQRGRQRRRRDGELDRSRGVAMLTWMKRNIPVGPESCSLRLASCNFRAGPVPGLGMWLTLACMAELSMSRAAMLNLSTRSMSLSLKPARAANAGHCSAPIRNLVKRNHHVSSVLQA